MQQAVDAGVPTPNAMTLATVDERGRPAARIVLLKEVDDRGFVFFTNYESRKAADLAAHPHAALVLFWEPLHRQVRIEGAIERVAPRSQRRLLRVAPARQPARRDRLAAVAADRRRAPRSRRGSRRSSARSGRPRRPGPRTGAAIA